MAAAIRVAETYVGNASYSSGAHWQTNPPRIDCSGLVMCGLAGAKFGSPFPSSYLGLNLTTRNLNKWTDPGSGAVGDIIYFANPGHIGIVTGSNTFLGSQGHGPAFAPFGPTAPYWGNPAQTSAPVFRRACVPDQQTATTGGGGGAGGVSGGAGGVSGGSGGGWFGISGSLVDILNLIFAEWSVTVSQVIGSSEK